MATERLMINGAEYAFNFGIGYCKRVDKKIVQPVEGMPGVSQNVGLRVSIAKLIDHDLIELENILLEANHGQFPRLTMDDLDAYIDDPANDVDALCEQVLGFFEAQNSSRKTVESIRELINQNEEDVLTQLIAKDVSRAERILAVLKKA